MPLAAGTTKKLSVEDKMRQEKKDTVANDCSAGHAR